MDDLRCTKCKQLQFKYEKKDDIIIIEVKCYACNNFNYLEIPLNKVKKTKKKDEKDNK